MVRSTTRGGGYPTLAAARDARSRATPSRIGLRGVHSVPSGTPPSRAPPSVPSGAPPSVPSGRHKRILLPPSPSSSDMFDDALPSPSDRYARELAKQLGREPNNFEVYKALHWDKNNSKWADTKSQKVALKIESLIANDQSLADDSNIDQSQRNKRIDDHYMTAVGGTSKKQRIYGIGKFGASQICSEGSQMSEAAAERLREEGRVEGRAEVQQKLDEYIARTSTLEARVEWMMGKMSTSDISPPHDLPTPRGPQTDGDGDGDGDASLSKD